MAFMKLINKDNHFITFGLLAVGFVIVVLTLFFRVSACLAPTVSEPRHDYTFKVKALSYIKKRMTLTKVLLQLPSLPTFSENWKENPQVYVYWTIKTRGDEEFSGRSIGALTPPYDSFIFSLQDDLEAKLRTVHSEQLFVNEVRSRIIDDVIEMYVEIRHPETNELLDTFRQKYNPEERKEDTWAID
jgi:hypothetical protein